MSMLSALVFQRTEPLGPSNVGAPMVYAHDVPHPSQRPSSRNESAADHFGTAVGDLSNVEASTQDSTAAVPATMKATAMEATATVKPRANVRRSSRVMVGASVKGRA